MVCSTNHPTKNTNDEEKLHWYDPALRTARALTLSLHATPARQRAGNSVLRQAVGASAGRGYLVIFFWGGGYVPIKGPPDLRGHEPELIELPPSLLLCSGNHETDIWPCSIPWCERSRLPNCSELSRSVVSPRSLFPESASLTGVRL